VNDSRRLMVIKGFGGPPAALLCPMIADLAELAVVYEHTETAFIEVDPEAERKSVEAAGDYIEAGGPDEIVPAALAYAADHEIDGIFTVSEPLLRQTAELAERLGIEHHHPVSAARVMTDKYEQREALRRHGLAAPLHAAIASSDDLSPALEAVGTPAVLKPAFGAGSMLIFRIDSAGELQEHYEAARARYSQTELLRGVEPRFDLEAVIPSQNWHGDDRFGAYGSVEALMFEGEFFPLAVSDRTPLLPPFRETGLLLPSSLPAKRRDEMVATARAAAEAAGATNGPLHIELMMTESGPWVIEINGRLGGSIPYIFQEITDLALFREIAKIALGIEPITSVEFDGIGGMFNRHPPPGEGAVKHVVGLEEVRQMPGVRRVMVGVHEGDRASSLLGLLGGMVRIICAAEEIDDLFNLRDRFVETLRFEVEAT
jgi:biotin carboxylase